MKTLGCQNGLWKITTICHKNDTKSLTIFRRFRGLLHIKQDTQAGKISIPFRLVFQGCLDLYNGCCSARACVSMYGSRGRASRESRGKCSRNEMLETGLRATHENTKTVAWKRTTVPKQETETFSPSPVSFSLSHTLCLNDLFTENNISIIIKLLFNCYINAFKM